MRHLFHLAFNCLRNETYNQLHFPNILRDFFVPSLWQRHQVGEEAKRNSRVPHLTLNGTDMAVTVIDFQPKIDSRTQ
ncbi:7454_t:CDS:2, partial [Ambispora gerdemannii]